MSNGDYIPPVDLTSTTIDAINLALQALGINPLAYILSLFSGRPKDQDTNAVIGAYNMSAYWPLHALSTNLATALRNGAPISDSRPAIQAQFGEWKQGTIESIQSFAGETPGPSSSGYWTLNALIDKSWAASSAGQGAVLQYVKAIDVLTQILSEQVQGAKTPVATQTGGGGSDTNGGSVSTGVGQCDSGDIDQDEVLDLCQALRGSIGAVLSTIKAIEPVDNSACCTGLIAAIHRCASQLTVIAAALANAESAEKPIDLTPIVTVLDQLVAAVSAAAGGAPVNLDPLTAAVNSVAAALQNPDDQVAYQLKRLADQNDAANALGKALVAHWAELVPGDPGTIQLLTT
jgi:hypothetical protein